MRHLSLRLASGSDAVDLKATLNVLQSLEQCVASEASQILSSIDFPSHCLSPKKASAPKFTNFHTGQGAH